MFLGVNKGTIISGDRACFNGKNDGVIISGSPLGNNSVKEGEKTYKFHNAYNGEGIWISGTFRKTVKEGEVDEGLTTNSFIHYSAVSQVPTIFLGNIQLDKNCNIKDCEGNYIVQNGKRK